MTVVRAFGAAALAVVLALGLAACTAQEAEPGAAPSETGAVAPAPAPVKFNSEFSRDGTFQSHIEMDGVDFVFTIWSAKTTPRMQEWYAKGDKYFSFTFQAYDTRQRLRDPFRTKRRVWLERVQISSQTTTKSGGSESPYNIDEYAPDITFDPEARTRKGKGMLITSPKGAFELRNQAIKDMADDTEGITLTFRATVHIQEQARSKKYTAREVTQVLPIAIFESEFATRPQPVPYNAT
ncbi:hypothetical protein JK386_16140 [Nocardioides sp. zg-536]|uniref:Uncharacterized protein n=1 Tax=Nocardioides faecalis TaxID=2803858 RepID=A0A938YCP2_9ACTN|nr:hypothetical protein [Nocardioides faecalis]MBM9461434.1 hypothetical protein [Nocardioides faecalis]QVI59376.1 hypothetical protein KG111_03120 [Nocardioides faecalis]